MRIPALFALVVTMLGATVALANLLSPGPLSKAHASYEGVKNCTECHVAGQQLPQKQCLACHEELAPRIAAQEGLHGRMEEGKRSCRVCHHEHQGRDFPLIQWGKGGREKFDHDRTGWKLEGAHEKVKCDDCHRAALVVDPVVRKLLAKRDGWRTHLGLPTDCASCHFDEHRGQFAKRTCDDCHTQEKWDPAKKFDHDETDFAREGRHRKVDCVKCHVERQDHALAESLFPRPAKSSFLSYTGTVHASCLDCHKDEHEGRFGKDCTGCHSPDDWKPIRPKPATRDFHENTRYPLVGAHAKADCAACHGTPFTAKDLAFGSCRNCHVDAHAGQLGTGREADCARCHSEEKFAPSTFGVEAHARTAFALEGQHRKVSCNVCHPKDERLVKQVPGDVRRRLKDAGRAELFSDFVLDRPEAKKGCVGCHVDAHSGQLGDDPEAMRCDRCHSSEGFLPVRFELADHARTKFPLDGAHRVVACVLCHANAPALAVGPGRKNLASSGNSRDRRKLVSPTVLRPTSEPGCQACHDDPHAGQFDERVAKTGCKACHETKSFATLSFDHSRDSRFALTGKHVDTPCLSCHVEEKTPAGAPSIRYRPLEQSCASCHVDVHVGQFASGSEPVDCARCHVSEGFEKTLFKHEPPFTDWLLDGAHAAAKCRSCHPATPFSSGKSVTRYKPVPRTCAECHVDEHEGTFERFVP